jgi:trigger factor
MSAQQYGMDPNEFAQTIDQQGQIPSIVQEVGRRKALAAVLDKATVTDTAGVVVDLDDLVAGNEVQAHDDHDHSHDEHDHDVAGDDAETSADEAPTDEAAAKA